MEGAGGERRGETRGLGSVWCVSAWVGTRSSDRGAGHE